MFFCFLLHPCCCFWHVFLFVSVGNSGGTDHGWGGHNFIAGGAVKGRWMSGWEGVSHTVVVVGPGLLDLCSMLTCLFLSLLLFCPFFHRWANFGKVSFKIRRVQLPEHLQLGWQIHPHDKLGSRLETNCGMVWRVARGNTKCIAQFRSFPNGAHYYSKRHVWIEMANTMFTFIFYFQCPSNAHCKFSAHRQWAQWPHFF